MTGRSYAQISVASLGLVAAVASGIQGWRVGGPYGERFDVDPRVERADNQTGQNSQDDGTGGRLERTALDADGDLKIDTWYFSNGDRLLRIEFDDDGNGTPDRRQYLGPDGAVVRTESLRVPRPQQ